MHADDNKSFICPTNAHTNYSKIAEPLKTFKTTIIDPKYFGLHKPSSGSSQSVLRQRSTDFELPDDSLCKPKHVGAIIVVLKVFNVSAILE